MKNSSDLDARQVMYACLLCAIISSVGLLFWFTIPVYSSHSFGLSLMKSGFIHLKRQSFVFYIIVLYSAQQFSLLVPVHLLCSVLVLLPLHCFLPTPSWYILFFTCHNFDCFTIFQSYPGVVQPDQCRNFPFPPECCNKFLSLSSPDIQ